MATSIPQLINRPPAADTPNRPAAGNSTPTDSFNATLYVIPGENPADLELLAHQYRDQFHAAGPVEHFLVDTLIHCDWRRRRLTRAENQFFRVLSKAFTDTSEPLGAGYEFDVSGSNALKSLFRQQAANERSYFRAITELRRLQDQRQSAPPAAVAHHAPLPAEPHHPQTGGVGFVPKSAAPPASPAPRVVINLGKGHSKEGLVFVG